MGTRYTPKHALRGVFWCSRQRGRGRGHVIHHKHALVGVFVVHKGVFMVFEMRGRGGNTPNIKTRHSGRVLVFKTSGRGAGTRCTPQTHPRRCVCGVRDEGKERERAEHQKHATWACFRCSAHLGYLVPYFGAVQGTAGGGGGESSWRRGERHEQRVFNMFGGCSELQLVRFLKKKKI